MKAEEVPVAQGDVNKTTFVIEHMEEYLYDWCLHEYLQMKKYLLTSGFTLQITNFGVVYSYHGDKK